MPKLDVWTSEGKKEGSVELPETVFKTPVDKGVLYQAVLKYLASSRQGTASTKGRTEVSGGGKKPWRQKGTGRARAGSIRSPLWHGGGVIFGPKPRDFGYDIPKKIKVSALREGLNAKFQDKNLYCLEDLKSSFGKTKEFAKVVKSLKLDGKILGVLDGSDQSVERVAKNMNRFQLMRAQDINAYDILRNKYLLVSKTALKNLLDRIKQ